MYLYLQIAFSTKGMSLAKQEPQLPKEVMDGIVCIKALAWVRMKSFYYFPYQ